MNAYTGIFQTQSEHQARRVLTHLFPLRNEPVRQFAFLFKDGWYEIIVPDILLLDEEAARLSLLARAVAQTDLPAAPLKNFTQGDLQPFTEEEAQTIADGVNNDHETYGAIFHDHTDDAHTATCSQCQREVLLETGD
jgi:hypothetical protein